MLLSGVSGLGFSWKTSLRYFSSKNVVKPPVIKVGAICENVTPTANEQICTASLRELRVMYETDSGVTPSVAQTEAFVRIAHAHRLNYIVTDRWLASTVAAETADAQFAGVAPKSLLCGVTRMDKDLQIQSAGTPHTQGSLDHQLLDTPSTITRELVSRLDSSGSVLLATTMTPLYGAKATTSSHVLRTTLGPNGRAMHVESGKILSPESEQFLRGIAVRRDSLNPYDVSKTTGGSSGGTAGAVRMGLCHFGLGSDGAGSIRIPASLCGIVGLKPEFGHRGLWQPFSVGSYTSIGPMARSVEDIAIIMDDLLQTGGSLVRSLDARAPPVRIGSSRDFGYGSSIRVDQDIENSFEHVAMLLSQAGFDLISVSPECEQLHSGVNLFETMFVIWASRMLMQYTLLEETQSTRKYLQAFDPEVKEHLVDRAKSFSRDQVSEALRQKALVPDLVQSVFTRSGADVIITPTLACSAWPIEEVAPFSQGYNAINWNPFTFPLNLSGHAAMTVPVGLDRFGIPIGLQIVARKTPEEPLAGLQALLRVGQAIEDTRIFNELHVPVFPDLRYVNRSCCA